MKIKKKKFMAAILLISIILILEDGTQIQVPFCDWERYKVGDIYNEGN
jgi:hypothetical protein